VGIPLLMASCVCVPRVDRMEERCCCACGERVITWESILALILEMKSSSPSLLLLLALLVLQSVLLLLAAAP